MSKSGGRKRERMDTLLRLVYGYQRISVTDWRIASRCLRKPGSAAVISDISIERRRSRVEDCLVVDVVVAPRRSAAQGRLDLPLRVAACPPQCPVPRWRQRLRFRCGPSTLRHAFGPTLVDMATK